MPLTANQYKQLLQTMVGDIPGDEVSSNTDLLWELHSGKPLYLRFLYAKRDALDIVIRYYRKAISFSSSGDLSVQRQQLFDHAMAERKLVDEEIATVGKRRRAGGAIAEIQRKAPIEPPRTDIPDANDPMYRGDAYRNRGREPQ